jgi:hypothetical protein
MSYSRSRNYSSASTGKPAYLKKDLGDQLKSFSPATNEAPEVVKITDVQVIGSYSWIDAQTPTIAVPGTLR